MTWPSRFVHSLSFAAAIMAAGLFLSGGMVAAPGAVGTEAVARSTSEPFFPIAVWYGGGKARAPMLEPVDASSSERWGRDLDQIKALGFNTVKCWVDWATAEPKPGEFHFEQLNLLLGLAQARGLRVIVQIYMDSAPDWVGERYPDGRFVDRSGAVIQSQAAPGYCIDHAGVRAATVKFIEALARDANRSRALYGWDVWSEPHVVNWAEFPYLTNPEFCFCANTQARFREWLKAKYKSLEALNGAWYRHFERWDQVEPPRASTILSYTDYLDWRAFIDEKLAADLATRVKAVRAADRTHPISSHAAVPGLFTSPTDGFGEPDDFKMSAAADFFGTSLYPKHAASTRPWSQEMLAAGLDFTRSAGHSQGKGFWIGELQAGQGATGMRIADPVTPADEEFWLWQALAHGAREIAIYAYYPMSSGYESNGYGLVDLDGAVTPRARAAGHLAQVAAQHAADFLGAEPARAQVAILYNRLSSMVGGAEPSLSKLGNAERDSLEGVHRTFTEANIPVDFVSSGDVGSGRVDSYKVLFLPYPVMLSRETGERVARYVEQGGTAVAEARLAWNDASGRASEAIPGAGLDRVFGAREKLIRPIETPHLFMEQTPILPSFAARELVTAAAFEEALEPLEGARVLAHFADSSVAMVEHPFGKGRAILVGTFLSLAYERQHDASTRRLLLALAESAGVTPEVRVTGDSTGEVEIRRLVAKDFELLFAFNHSRNPADAEVSLGLPWPAIKARELTTDEPVTVEKNQGRTILKRKLAGGEIWVVRLSER